MTEKSNDLIIKQEDFDAFATQMIYTFPLMPESVRKQWSERVLRCRSRPVPVLDDDDLNSASIPGILKQGIKDRDAAIAARTYNILLEEICDNCGGLADGGEQCKSCYVKVVKGRSV